MDKKKITLISIIVLEVIIFLIVLIYTIEGLKSKKEDLNILNTVIEDNLSNVIDVNTEEKENVIENTVEENIIEEPKQEEPIADPEQEIDMSTLKKQESNQEKAISIAKEAWGNDGTVIFTFEEEKDGIYIIYVRDIATSRQIDTIKVNINTGKVVK